MGTIENGLTVLMFPWLAHGHTSPNLELAKKLSKRDFCIYICSTPINLASIKNKITEEYSSSIQLVELHLPNLPELPPEYHTTNGLPLDLNPILAKALKMAKPAFSEILKTLNPDLLIHDVTHMWAADVASSHNIPSVSSHTSSVAMVTYICHLMMKPGVEYPYPAIYLRDFEFANFIPKLEDARDSSQDNEEEASPKERPDRSSSFMLVKSFREIEGKYMDYFADMVKRKIVPVGPLVQEVVEENEHSVLIEWLGKKDKSSSLFVSFGTEYFLSEAETVEIAHGLELSNMNFIWVIRFPKGEKNSAEEALPEGFLDRVRDRGRVVVGWAPQADILRHPSIGGFVSHCGWNSVLESMQFGVPIIAIPMHLDQPLNARLVADAGFGLEAFRDNNGMLHRDEVAKVIREVVIEKSGEKIRRKAKEWREIMISKGDQEIDVAVEELLRLCERHKGQI